MVYTYMPNFVSIGLFCRPLAAKTPQFLPFLPFFWTSAFSDVANWHQSQEVEHGCTTTNIPLSNGMKLVSVGYYSNAFMAKSGAQTLTFKSVTDRQTDKKSTFLATLAAGKIRAPPNLAW